MITEYEQVQIGEQWFFSQGLQTYLEVPIFSSSLDLLLVDEKRQLHGVEFKLSNWQRVLKQAKRHKIALDYVSVFLIKPKTARTERQIVSECQKQGIGLFFLDGITRVYQSVAPLNNQTWKVEKDKVFEYLKVYREYETDQSTASQKKRGTN